MALAHDLRRISTITPTYIKAELFTERRLMFLLKLNIRVILPYKEKSREIWKLEKLPPAENECLCI